MARIEHGAGRATTLWVASTLVAHRGARCRLVCRAARFLIRLRDVRRWCGLSRPDPTQRAESDEALALDTSTAADPKASKLKNVPLSRVVNCCVSRCIASAELRAAQVGGRAGLGALSLNGTGSCSLLLSIDYTQKPSET